jgi:hypothetical protein
VKEVTPTALKYIKACSDKALTMPQLETMTIYRDDFDWIKTIEELLDYQEHAVESAKTIYRLGELKSLRRRVKGGNLYSAYCGRFTWG